MAQLGRALRSGRKGRRFESCHPDQIKEYTLHGCIFLSIFEYVLENKEFVKNTYYSISRDFFLRFIYKQTTVLLMNIIDEKSKGMKVRREDKQFMADFYKYGFVGIMQDWIESGMKEKPDNIIKKLNSIIEGNFENALEKLKCSN